MFSQNKEFLILLNLFKHHNICEFIVSPGATHSWFVANLQQDNYFNLHSAIDERSAAYIACGISETKLEPVALTCTSATSSRNYLPAITEAYYRKIPLLVITCMRDNEYFENTLTPQRIDRSEQQVDTFVSRVTLPEITNGYKEFLFNLMVNSAINDAISKKGPVLIQVPATTYGDFNLNSLTTCSKINTISNDTLLKSYHKFQNNDLEYNFLYKSVEYIKDKKIAIFIGCHSKFDDNTLNSIENFTKKFNTVIYKDHTSHYYGRNAIQFPKMLSFSKPKTKVDLVIDLGGISAIPSYYGEIFSNTEIWRISEDLKLKRRAGKLSTLFCCSEYAFFSIFASCASSSSDDSLFNEIQQNLLENKNQINASLETLPLSTCYVAYKLSQKIPSNSYLQCAILESIKYMNLFELNNIECSSNVGAFGIDGTLSTLIGHSFTDPSKNYFCMLGDLAFTYDMNSLTNREIKNNLRIFVINNNIGFSMKLGYAKQINEKADRYICAQGHKISIKGYAQDLGFDYYLVNSKEELNSTLDVICNPSFNKSVIVEIKVLASNEKISANTIETFRQNLS